MSRAKRSRYELDVAAHTRDEAITEAKLLRPGNPITNAYFVARGTKRHPPTIRVRFREVADKAMMTPSKRKRRDRVKAAQTIACPYCGKPCSYSPTSGHRYCKDYGPIVECVPCEAWVGTHDHNGVPKGVPAKAGDRELRKEAHRLFDSMWARKMARDQCSKTQARRAAYEWLRERMEMTADECHIAMMHGDQLRRVIEACRPYCR